MTDFALRFDGYKYCDVTGIDPHVPGPGVGSLYLHTLEFFKNPDYSKPDDYLRMILFFIQRKRIREGWIDTDDALMEIVRTIFLKLADKPMNPDYIFRIHGTETVWQRTRVPRLEAWKKLVQERHSDTNYQPFDSGGE